ncbi:hypothetical protein A2U01_0065071, partial [Trifolium medium]|nr:hypothetical protein [Trifolium medium]
MASRRSARLIERLVAESMLDLQNPVDGVLNPAQDVHNPAEGVVNAADDNHEANGQIIPGVAVINHEANFQI